MRLSKHVCARALVLGVLQGFGLTVWPSSQESPDGYRTPAERLDDEPGGGA